MGKEYCHPNNIKYILIAFISVSLTVSYIINSPQLIFAQKESVENLKEYENNLFGIKIKHPSTWKIDKFEKKIKDDNDMGINKIVAFCPDSTLKQVPSDQIKTMTTDSSNNTFLCSNAEKRLAISVHNLPDGMDLA